MTYSCHCKLQTMSYLRSLLMLYSLRHIAPQSKFAHALHLDIFEHLIPPTLIGDVLTETQGWEEREKTLNMPMVIAIVIAMGLFASCSIPHVLHKLACGLRCATSGLIRACACQEPVPSANVGSLWASRRCAACSSGSANRVPPKRRRGSLPSACG